jgi:uncharacterized membrane protein (UPF0127 family)
MRFSLRQQKQTKGLVHVPAMSDDDGKNNRGLMNRTEKGFFEALLFTFSVVLHLSHSLEGEHVARL